MENASNDSFLKLSEFKHLSKTALIKKSLTHDQKKHDGKEHS